MKVKMLVLIKSLNSLKVLCSLKIPVKTSFKLSRLMKKINEEVTIYEELQKKLVDEYGVIGDDKEFKVVSVGSEHYEKVNLELNEILDTEIEFDFEPINIEELGNIEIEPAHLHSLEHLFI